MVDFSLAIPLIISSSLAAPIGSYLNVRIDAKPFLILLAIVLALAGVRMLMSPAVETENRTVTSSKKIIGGLGIGAAIEVMGGLLGIGGGVLIVPLLI